MDPYIKKAAKIYTRIRTKSSKSNGIAKQLAWNNFIEAYDELKKTYVETRKASEALSNYHVDLEKSYKGSEQDHCDELQRSFVRKTKDFHVKLYTCTSAYMNLLKVNIGPSYRRGIKVNSIASFHTSLQTKYPTLIPVMTILEKSRVFRSFVTHPEQHSAHDWFTLQSRNKQNHTVLIYFLHTDAHTEKDRKQYERLLGSVGEESDVYFYISGTDFKAPPDLDKTYNCAKKFYLQSLAIFKDSNT